MKSVPSLLGIEIYVATLEEVMKHVKDFRIADNDCHSDLIPELPDSNVEMWLKDILEAYYVELKREYN